MRFCRDADEKGLSIKIHPTRLVSNPPLIITLYQPWSRYVKDEVVTPESVLNKVLKLLVMSLHRYHTKLYGPVPPGLLAIIAPFCVPDALQKIKTGSLTVGADG